MKIAQRFNAGIRARSDKSRRDGRRCNVAPISSAVSSDIVFGMTLETYLRPSQLAGAVPRLAIARTNNDVVITWTGAGFVFESANEPSGDWASVPGAASPYTISSPAANRFYRLRR